MSTSGQMNTNDLTLLIVEKDEKVVDIIQQSLVNIFNKIIVAENGETGFQEYRMARPDLVISTIYMPVLNGIDMTKKIRKIDKTARIILVSEAHDSSLLIKAIENSIKGFLFKPINTENLVKVVDDQVDKINYLKRMKSVEQRTVHAEKKYDKSKRILQVISQASTMFYGSGFYEKTVTDVLKMIGELIEASRVYIYKNYIENEDEFTSRVYEWTAGDIMPVLGNLLVTKRHIVTSGFGRWVGVMKKHKGYITGYVKDFSLAEQERLKEHNIKAILAIPIFADNLWWGFLGIDDCKTEKVWTEPEISALESLANFFGAAIQKRDMDEQLIRLNLGLEKRVKARTRELELEVAERAMAEALLKDSEEKYRLIYENATDGILLLQKGTIMLANPAMIEILEELPRNLIGRKFSSLVAKENRKELKRQFKKERGDISADVFHVQVVVKKDQVKWLELKPTRISWYGEPAELVFVSNITLRKQVEGDLTLLNETLEKRVEEEVRQVEHQQQLLMQKSKLESIGELSAGLAHEINQPLVSISMGLDNMLMRMDENKHDHEYIKNKIHLLFNDIDRIKNTIEHVRIFSRDQQNSNLDEVNINQVVYDAISMINRQLKDQHIQLDIDCQQPGLFILGNRYKLEQVILNLISNARYAVNERSKKSDTDNYQKRITISTNSIRGKAAIWISDNGIGIPEEILPDIFNPFFTTKAEDKGTGLGLSISYGIIKEMDGEIFAESKQNEYTKITVILPLPRK